MDRLGPAGGRHVENFFLVQVGFGRRRAVERIAFPGVAQPGRPGVRIAVDSHRRHPELAAGQEEAAGDFAPIGDEYFGKHGGIL